MLQVFIIIGYIGAALWIGRNILFWVSLWQLKEYRFDRLRAHLRETKQGKHVWCSLMSFLKWGLVLAYIIVVFNDSLSHTYAIVISVLYIIEGCIVLLELVTRRLKRPAKTAKALLIILLSASMLGFFAVLPMTDIPLWIVLLDRATVLIVSLFVFFFSFPTEIYMDMKIQKAREKIQSHTKLLVIAVSGSYGKSSTKEYISQILAEKFSVVKTEGSNNTPIGIAMTILNRIQQDTQLFVVEMGAYKQGEVAELCDIVQPDISVTTSVSDQHLSLFGSLENAMETEMELIHALPKTGIALFNGNNENSTKLYKKTKKKKILYKSQPDKKEHDVDVPATNISMNKDGVSFDVIVKGKAQQFTTPLLGTHNVENILPGIYIAGHLGIPLPKIKKAVAHLIPPPKTMTKKVLTNGVTLVDDTFNASPESVMAAITYMESYDKKKFLILTPLIELGEHAKQRHYMLGTRISTTIDYLFLTNNNFYSDIMKGIIEGNGKCVVKVAKADQIAEDIIESAASDDVVLFEGKESAKVLAKLS